MKARKLPPFFILYGAVIACVIFIAASCVTSGDLQRVTDSVAQLETVLDDPLATQAELEAAIASTTAEIEAVVEDVEERTEQAAESGLSLAEGGGLAGIITGVGMLVLNQLRNHSREKALGKVA